MRHVIFVNGYGATRDRYDENYIRYLSAVNQCIESRPQNSFEVYLCGGYTNRTDLSEAASMRNVWEELGVPENATVCLIEWTTTARDNLLVVRGIGDVPITIFCEYSRRWTMHFLASRFFRYFFIFGVPFDDASFTILNLFKQIFFNLPLEILAFYLNPPNRLRLLLRKRHVEALRRREK